MDSNLFVGLGHPAVQTTRTTRDVFAMDSGPETPGSTHLTWANVGLAFAFILLDGVLSTAFGLGVGSSLVTAAVRCVVQLSVVALILRQVFETNNPWAVAGMACLLNLMGTAETGELHSLCDIWPRQQELPPHSHK